MNLYDAAYSVLKNTYIVEMAIGKKEYDDKVFALLPNIIDHFLLIHCFGGASNVHWANELSAFCGQLIRVKYRHTKKQPTTNDFLKHVKESGHDYDTNSLKEICNILSKTKKIPCYETNFVKVHQEFEKFLKLLASHVQSGFPISFTQLIP